MGIGAVERAIDALVEGVSATVALLLSAVLYLLCRLLATSLVPLLQIPIHSDGSVLLLLLVVAAWVDTVRFRLRHQPRALLVVGAIVSAFGLMLMGLAFAGGVFLFPVPDAPALNHRSAMLASIVAAGVAGPVWGLGNAMAVLLLGLALCGGSCSIAPLRQHVEPGTEWLGMLQAAGGIGVFVTLLLSAFLVLFVAATGPALDDPAAAVASLRWRAGFAAQVALACVVAALLVLHCALTLNRMEARREAREAARAQLEPAAVAQSLPQPAPRPALPLVDAPRHDWRSFQAADAAQALRRFIGPAGLDAAARIVSPVMARILWAALWLLCRCMAMVIAAVMQWPVVHAGSPMLLAAAGVDLLRFLVRRTTWLPVLLGVPVIALGVAVAYVAFADGMSLLHLPSGGTPLLNPTSRTLAIVEVGGAGETTLALSHAFSIMAVGLVLCVSGERSRWQWQNHQKINEPMPLSLIARYHATFAFLLLLLLLATHTTIVVNERWESLASIVARGSWVFRFALDSLMWQLTFAAFLALCSWGVLNLMAHREEARRQAAAASATPAR